MTKTHAAVQLLRLGPLSLDDFTAITGWPRHTARITLRWLVIEGRAVFTGRRFSGCYSAV